MMAASGDVSSDVCTVGEDAIRQLELQTGFLIPAELGQGLTVSERLNRVRRWFEVELIREAAAGVLERETTR